jgi:Skp family chaperone for outer membrane proteins
MKMKLLLTLTFLLLAAPGAFAQTAPDGATKMKVAIIDSAVFRDEVLELKAKYEKLQSEFAPKARDLEAMANTIASKQKVAQENKTLTAAQAQKLVDEIEQLKKDYNRALQDSQDLAGKREKAETEDVFEKLSKFLEDYCSKKGITTVFDARRLQDTGVVVYAAPTSNITKDFISEYNKANPVQTAANPAK